MKEVTFRNALVVILFIMSSINAMAEGVPFNGVVTDLLGAPIKNVKVWVKNKNHYAMSDKKGRFGLTDVHAHDTLHIKYRKLYYAIPVNGKKSARIKLAHDVKPTMSEDQELVDIGYGYVKRREVTTSTSGISGEELRRSGQTDILAALEGRVPGLNIETSGRPGDEATVNIRGIHSLYGSNEPLYIVDGVIVSDFTGISVYDVDYVEVMRDAPIYGSQGANGAIIVHTLKASSE